MSSSDSRSNGRTGGIREYTPPPRRRPPMGRKLYNNKVSDRDDSSMSMADSGPAPDYSRTDGPKPPPPSEPAGENGSGEQPSQANSASKAPVEEHPPLASFFKGG